MSAPAMRETAPPPILPLPPTAATLLSCDESDSRAVLTVIASDIVATRAVQVVATTLGYEPNLSLLVQRAGPAAVGQLAMALDLWASGARVRCSAISATQMALGPLTVGCLAPLALPGELGDLGPDRIIGTAAFAIFGSLSLSLVARQDPARFERVAELARYRGVPLADVYRHVAGETIHVAALRLAEGWHLPRLLLLALAGPPDSPEEGAALDEIERERIGALQLATIAARAAAASVEPWPYVGAEPSMENHAFQGALSLRARRIAGKLAQALPRMASAA